MTTHQIKVVEGIARTLCGSNRPSDMCVDGDPECHKCRSMIYSPEQEVRSFVRRFFNQYDMNERDLRKLVDEQIFAVVREKTD